MADYEIKEGATTPPLIVDLFDKFGTPDQAPVTGLDDPANVIEFVFRHSSKSDPDPPDLRAPGAYYNDPVNVGVYSGAVWHEWLDSAETRSLGQGTINFDIYVTWPDGKLEKFPPKDHFQFEVTEDLEAE